MFYFSNRTVKKMRRCKFLNNAIFVDEQDKEKYVEEQFLKFKTAFIDNTTYIGDLPIKVTNDKDNNNYGTILNNPRYRLTNFVHIVSSQVDQNKKYPRELNIQRLKTCHWAKELIDYYNSNNRCVGCKDFLTKIREEKEGEKLYIFCKAVRYVVVLLLVNENNMPHHYVINTAFYVDKEYSYRQLIRKLQ